MAECIRKITTLLSATALVAGLSACESTGSTRFSSVGSGGLQGPQGAPGPQGPAGPAGPSGQGGTGLGSTGALLANTGDPNSRIPAVSGVLVATGGVVRTVAGQGTILANVVDAHAPGGIPLAGTVIGVVDATGQALIRTGNGQEYLVDGLTAAPGELVNLTIGNAQVLGTASQSPLIGASVLSPTQSQGTALTVGVGSAGQLLTLNSDSTGGTQTNTNPIQGVVNTVTGTVSGLPLPTGQTGSTTPVTGTVQGVVNGVTGLLGGVSGQ